MTAAAGQVVVLGGTGCLGGQIRQAFSGTGARVLTVSRTVPDGTPDAARMDLASAEPQRLAELLDRAAADVVVNAAGLAFGATEAEMTTANAHLVDRVVEAIRLSSGRPRLIQLGTVHEYSPGPPGEGITEDQPTVPVTPYGRSKLLGSQSILRAARDAGLDAVVLRIANACGPGAPRQSLLGVMAERLAGFGSARHSGAGTPEPYELRLAPMRAQRDFVDIRDVVDAVLAVAAAPAEDVAGEVVNIGSGQAVHVRELIDRLVTLSGLPVRVVEEPVRDSARTDIAWQQLDIAKARRLLGWKPHRGLDESLSDMLAAA